MARDIFDPLSDTMGTNLPSGRDVRDWGSATPNKDISSVLQAAIDDCYARNDSTPIIIPALPGLGTGAGFGVAEAETDAWLANVVIKPNVCIAGQGWRSILKSNPGASTPVIGSAKSATDSTLDPSRNRILNLAIYGNRTHGATGRGIELVSNLSDAVRGYGSLPQKVGDTWNDLAPVLSGLLVMDCAGEGVVLGRNMRGAWFDRSFVFRNVGTGLLVNCTDAQFSNLQFGVNGDGVVVQALANQFNNCKAWFSYGTVGGTDLFGVNHTGQGVGFVCQDHPTATGDGSLTQFTGCESQDNFKYGMLADNVVSLVVNGHMTGGDGSGAICVKGSNARFNTFRFSNVWGSRTQVAALTVIDGTGGTPTDNLFEFEDAEAGLWISRPGGFVPVSSINGGSVIGNTVRWAGSQGRMAPTATLSAGGTYTPNARYGLHQLNMPAGNITVATPTNGIVGNELTFVIFQDSVGSRTVTWSAAWLGAAGTSASIPALNTAATVPTTYKFISTGSFYRLVSKT
jgi:hypothetical protein